MKDTVFTYIKKKYKTSPEYLWKKYPDYAIFRHADNNKWFALQAAVPGNPKYYDIIHAFDDTDKIDCSYEDKASEKI